MAFSRKWDQAWDRDHFEEHLPRLYDLGEDEVIGDISVDERDAEGPSDLTQRLESKIAEVLDGLRASGEVSEANLEQALSKLAGEGSAIQEKILQTDRGIEGRLSQLERTQTWNRGLIYVVIILLIAVVLMIW